jgi:hypothetical protein
MSDGDRAAGPFDPGHYVEHVTRTSLLLEQLARDVKALREQTESSARDTGALRGSVAVVERDFAVFKVDALGRAEVNKESIRVVTERLQWLSRLVIGALVTSVLGGLVAWIYRLAG